MVANFIYQVFELYWWVIIIRVFLTWIPSINWYDGAPRALSMLVDPYLNLFRRIIPPFSGIDFSPIIALILLRIIQSILTNLFLKIGI